MAVIRAVVAGVLLGLLTVSPVYATHGVPSPRWRWDLDNDKIVDESDSNIGFFRIGVWNAQQVTSFNSFLAAWSSNTRYDPYNQIEHGGVARATYRIDGVHPCGGAWGQFDLAITCIVKNDRFEGGVVSFRDIEDADTGIKLAGNAWYYGPNAPGALQYDFRSNGAHEIGHTVTLIGLVDFGTNCGNPEATMCEQLDAGTTHQRTLTNDDIDGANQVYPQ